MLYRVLTQKEDDSNKVYSVYEPEVLCISKGKEYKKCDFKTIVHFHELIEQERRGLKKHLSDLIKRFEDAKIDNERFKKEQKSLDYKFGNLFVHPLRKFIQYIQKQFIVLSILIFQ